MTDDNFLRRSQVITGFGPGALVDLPEHSVIIGGLGQWRGYQRYPVKEPRLQAKLAQALNVNAVDLYMPPAFFEDDLSPGSIPGRIFPTWFITQKPVANGGGRHKRRRLVGYSLLKRGVYEDPEETKTSLKKKRVVPVRFVCGCTKGHVEDLDWRTFAHHGQKTCQQTLWVEERGTSGDVADIVVGCDCGFERRLYEAQPVGTLGICNGKRPWLGDFAGEACTERSRLLMRTASNAYFAETLSVISLPDGDDRLRAAVDRCWTDLEQVNDVPSLATLKRFNAAVRAELDGFGDDEIMAEIDRKKAGTTPADDGGVKIAEFRVLSSGKPTIGLPDPDSTFFAETLPRGTWDPGHDHLLGSVDRVVAVHRLREVIAQVGFSRFDAVTVDEAGELDIQTERAALDVTPSWFPAIENRGEGLFVQFKAEDVASWELRDPVKFRAAELGAGFDMWKHDHTRSSRRFPGMAYVLMHSISHILLTEVALECGYPASSLRERVYGFDGMYGVLLMTATSGSEGTLGGLAACASKVGSLLRRAVEAAALCSNDPVCAQHTPADQLSNRPLQGASCHGCTLIAETSCEQRNDLLDRALVVDTLASTGTGFFTLP